MNKKNSVWAALPVLFGFFVMGFCDIVGISSDSHEKISQTAVRLIWTDRKRAIWA